MREFDDFLFPMCSVFVVFIVQWMFLGMMLILIGSERDDLFPPDKFCLENIGPSLP